MEIPEELYYTEDHEWAAVDAEVATVGITDFSQKQRGEIELIELPKEGAVVEAGRAFAVIHAANSVADVYAPVSGEVVEVNEELDDDPEMLSLSCYEDGWIAKIRIDNTDEVEMLMEAEDYQDLVVDQELE